MLQIDLKGNLAAMLGAAHNAKWRASDTDDLHLQVKMVAGACNQRYSAAVDRGGVTLKTVHRPRFLRRPPIERVKFPSTPNVLEIG